MRKQLAFWIVVSFLLSIRDAHAYLDPGTGGMLLQAVIAAIAAGAVLLRLYWQRTKAFLFRRRQKATAPADSVLNEDDAG